MHTFRLVTDDGDSRLIKWHFKTKQGKASLIWDEAQHIAGKNADYHRQDLWDAIESGNYPEWELAVQIVDEEDALAFGFDVLDPTKIIPEELAPLFPLGVLRLDDNPVNYFAETEQIMVSFHHRLPLHVDEDRLTRSSSNPDTLSVALTSPRILCFRVASSLILTLSSTVTVVPISNNSLSTAPLSRSITITVMAPARTLFTAILLLVSSTVPVDYDLCSDFRTDSPNTLNKGSPKQANQTQGRGFFTAPDRKVSGSLTRKRSSTFADHWSQPRLFYNSLSKVEQQFVINAMRFEMSHLSPRVQENVLIQLNRVSHDVAERIARALGLEAPEADDTYYHNNKTADISIIGTELPTIAMMQVGVLASTSSDGSMSDAAAIKEAFKADNVTVAVVGETLADGVDITYSQAEAVGFDGIIVTEAALPLLDPRRRSSLYPPSRPAQIIADGYNWGKPLGFIGDAEDALKSTAVRDGDGIYIVGSPDEVVRNMREGLAVFKFVDRFALDDDDESKN